MCTICDMKAAPVFEMRGLCYGTTFDKHFSWTGLWDEETEHSFFRGFSNSIIKWNNEKKEWHLKLYEDETIYAICNETSVSKNGIYPFGVLDWYFFQDTCKRDEPIQGTRVFKFRISLAGDNFNSFLSNQTYSHLLVISKTIIRNNNKIIRILNSVHFSMHI